MFRRCISVLLFLFGFFASSVFASGHDIGALEANIRAARIRERSMHADINGLAGNQGVLHTELNDLIKNQGLAEAEGILEAIKLFKKIQTAEDVRVFSAKTSEVWASFQDGSPMKMEDARLEASLRNPRLSSLQITKITKEQLESLHQKLSSARAQFKAMEGMYADFANATKDPRLITPNAVLRAENALETFNTQTDEIQLYLERIKPVKTNPILTKPKIRIDPSQDALRLAPDAEVTSQSFSSRDKGLTGSMREVNLLPRNADGLPVAEKPCWMDSVVNTKKGPGVKRVSSARKPSIIDDYFKKPDRFQLNPNDVILNDEFPAKAIKTPITAQTIRQQAAAVRSLASINAKTALANTKNRFGKGTFAIMLAHGIYDIFRGGFLTFSEISENIHGIEGVLYDKENIAAVNEERRQAEKTRDYTMPLNAEFGKLQKELIDLRKDLEIMHKSDQKKTDGWDNKKLGDLMFEEQGGI